MTTRKYIKSSQEIVSQFEAEKQTTTSEATIQQFMEIVGPIVECAFSKRKEDRFRINGDFLRSLKTSYELDFSSLSLSAIEQEFTKEGYETNIQTRDSGREVLVITNPIDLSK